MASIINTNVPSLTAQRNLSMNQASLATAMQRLSSGLRINSAKDDAAGLAISDRMTTQIRGSAQAARNANDGISLAQTAEGALAEVSNNLQRIRELAVQSRNATNSVSDRAALDAEVQQRIAEVNRVATQSEFNGTKLLDGSFSSQVFQIGANQGQTIAITGIAAVTQAALGLNGGNLNRFSAAGTAVTGPLSNGDLTINGVNVGAVAGDAKAIASAINNTDSRLNATATNAQTAITFDSIVGAGATPSTVTPGTYTPAVANGVAPSVTPAVATTVTPGAFTPAVSDGTAAVATDITYGAWTPAVSGANAATAAATTTSGVFTGVTLGSGQTFSMDISTAQGSFQLFSQTDGVVTATDIDTAVTAHAADFATAGITVAGTAAAGTLAFTNALGNDITTTVVNQSGLGGAAGASFATGTNTTAATGTAGVLADNGTAFTMTIDGITLYSEPGSVGGTVTAAELDTALTTFLSGNPNYTKVSGSFAGGNLRLTDAAGDGITIGFTQFSGGTNAVTPGALALTTTNAAGSTAVAPTAGNFTLELDGAMIYTEAASVGGTVTAAELDAGLNAYLAGAGSGSYTKTGSFATNDLVISKLDGTDATLAITSNFSAGTAGALANLPGDTLTSTNGSPAVVNPGTATTDTAFTMEIDGIQLYTEAAAIGGTVTAAELDSALTTFLTLNTGYSKTGTFAGNDLVLSKANGTEATIAITSNFSGTPGAFTGALTSVDGVPATVAAADYALTLDGTAVNLTSASGDGTITAAELATAINNVAGFSASESGGELSITKADGSNFVLAESGTLAATQGLAAASTTYRGTVAINSNVAATIAGADPTKAGLTAGTIAASSVAYGAANVLDAAAADIMIEVMDNALGIVNSSRGALGSIQNRFETVIANLGSTTENLTAARSRIQDADFAAETANLSRSQILQQAATAMVAQANQLPQGVLTLLRQ